MREDIERARGIMGSDFIGIEELNRAGFLKRLNESEIPIIPFEEKDIIIRKGSYLLVLGMNKLENGRPLTIRNLIDYFGKDPAKGEPCFYNQDWYDKESFMDSILDMGWFFIRKEIYEESRAIEPSDLMMTFSFPSAVRCCYVFFVSWLGLGLKLWETEFVWCSDLDHNGDRIYVGKYYDADEMNKNGFSIHRYLAIRSCYGCVD